MTTRRSRIRALRSDDLQKIIDGALKRYDEAEALRRERGEPEPPLTLRESLARLEHAILRLGEQISEFARERKATAVPKPPPSEDT